MAATTTSIYRAESRSSLGYASALLLLAPRSRCFLTSTGDVFSCGSETYAAHGHGLWTCPLPRHVIHLREPVHSIASGGAHSLFLMADGHVRACGGGWCVQLGLPEGQVRQLNGIVPPTVIGSLGDNIVKVCADDTYSFAYDCVTVASLDGEVTPMALNGS